MGSNEKRCAVKHWHFHGRADVGVSAPEMGRESECVALWVSLFQGHFIGSAIRRGSGCATAVTPYRFVNRHAAGKWARPAVTPYRAWRFNFYLIGDPASLLRTLPPLVGSPGWGR